MLKRIITVWILSIMIVSNLSFATETSNNGKMIYEKINHTDLNDEEFWKIYNQQRVTRENQNLPGMSEKELEIFYKTAKEKQDAYINSFNEYMKKNDQYLVRDKNTGNVTIETGEFLENVERQNNGKPVNPGKGSDFQVQNGSSEEVTVDQKELENNQQNSDTPPSYQFNMINEQLNLIDRQGNKVKKVRINGKEYEVNTEFLSRLTILDKEGNPVYGDVIVEYFENRDSNFYKNEELLNAILSDSSNAIIVNPENKIYFGIFTKKRLITFAIILSFALIGAIGTWIISRTKVTEEEKRKLYAHFGAKTFERLFNEVREENPKYSLKEAQFKTYKLLQGYYRKGENPYDDEVDQNDTIFD